MLAHERERVGSVGTAELLQMAGKRDGLGARHGLAQRLLQRVDQAEVGRYRRTTDDLGRQQFTLFALHTVVVVVVVVRVQVSGGHVRRRDRPDGLLGIEERLMTLLLLLMLLLVLVVAVVGQRHEPELILEAATLRVEVVVGAGH